MQQLEMSQSFGLPFLDLQAFDSSFIPREIISLPLMREHRVLPLASKDNYLYLAVSDPTNRAGFDEIKFYTGLVISIILVEEDQLKKIIQEIISGQEQVEDLSNMILSQDATTITDTINSQENEIEDAPIVRLVQKILLEALTKGASDIHFEPYEKNYRIRFRIDGILYEVSSPPILLSQRIAARIKILAQLDIAERRIPQDGRFKIASMGSDSIDLFQNQSSLTPLMPSFRVSTCPTLYGEKIVLRILETNTALMNFMSLGLEPTQLDIFKTMIHKSQGLILVTGPTGSGKTVSLYTVLQELNTSQVNILTIEDPIEIPLLGINQVASNAKTGLTFANALRSFLRQDPDIIMVGEIRDLETAEISIKAAQTGHLVLSTLHTNSAAGTLNRLINMGVAPYNLASCTSLIIAQRLVRKLCEYCKRETKFENNEVGDGVFYKPIGCEKCTEGYKGRIGIFEMLVVTEDLGRIILQGGNAMDLQLAAKNAGMQTLRESGWAKIRAGITSLAELNRVTDVI